MIRVSRESSPRACDGCGKTRLVLLVVVGDKACRICSDCNRAVQQARDRVYTENLESVETR